MGRGDSAPGDVWSRRDWLLAQALTEYESLLCGGCGRPVTESMDSANEFGFGVTVMQCHACMTVSQEAQKFKDHEHPAALHFAAHKKT